MPVSGWHGAAEGPLTLKQPALTAGLTRAIGHPARRAGGRWEMWCFRCGASEQYVPKEVESAGGVAPTMHWAHIGEPHTTELTNYVKQRGDHVHIYHTAAEVRSKMLRAVTDDRQFIDLYPKGRQFLADDEYMVILRDLLNLSNILDDMEQTGWVPYQARTPYYNLYSKLYRLLMNKAGR